jgi:Putative metal-binding motif/CARDB
VRSFLLPLLALLACNNSGKSNDSVDTMKPVVECDEDGDGYCANEGDCDDGDASIFPGAVESCDGIDNNCNGTADEGALLSFYPDQDNDGFGDPLAPQEACEAPSGFLTDHTDCDDATATIYPGALEVCDQIDNNCDGNVDEGLTSLWFADGDEDGYGDPNIFRDTCVAPDGYVADNTDCDDSSARAYPGNIEICDQLDNNCDGQVDEGVSTIWYADFDEDGYGSPTLSQSSCTPPAGYVQDASDCDDLLATAYPGAPEVCNGVDDDCDGTVDENDAVDVSRWYVDGDQDGYGDSNSSIDACTAPLGYAAAGGDCDDAVAAVNPGATEICDGLDNDCDGSIDVNAVDASTWYVDLDGDNHGSLVATTLSCTRPSGYSATADDCNDATVLAYPGATEVCDYLDNDCDGTVDVNAADAQTWFVDTDADGYGENGTGALYCQAPYGYAANNLDCDDADGNVHPSAPEYCDGIDQDCDGVADDSAVDASRWYLDADGDNFGDPSIYAYSCSEPAGYVPNALDCDDAASGIYPTADEYCDGVDEDCDGTIDENAADAQRYYSDLDGDGYGDPSSFQDACTAPANSSLNTLDCDDSSATTYPTANEFCNGTDDDCDGSIDEGAIDVHIWYQDTDGDGFGQQTSSAFGCTAPTGYVASSADCDDSDSAVAPGQDEYCNGVDDDCDGTADDNPVNGVEWHPDADGDGYGNMYLSVTACSAPGGYYADNSDCNDADAAINPEGAEAWYDGVDSDCNGSEDPDFCTEEPPIGTVSTDPTCTYVPTGSFNPTVEWSISSFATYANYKHVIMAPMVGELTDDNGDGAIDQEDTPDIAFVAFSRASGAGSDGVLRIVSGTGYVEKLAVSSKSYNSVSYAPYRYSNIALGDIDNDGETEIVATVYRSSNSTCYTGAYDVSGNLEWVYTATAVGCRSHAPALADLEGDGDVEVIMGRLVLNGNGTLQANGTGGQGYYSAYSNSGFMSFAADLDADGDQEVIAGSSIYNANGSSFCATGTTDGYPAVANLDSDAQGEFVVVAGGTIRVFDTNCTQLYSYSVYGGGYGGPPTIADYDGDGHPEIGLPGNTYYTVYEVDGTRLWSAAITDASSHSTGSSVFDFEGDGSAEVVYADETRLWVFDGATGSVLVQNSQHGSGTVNEYPTIADIDGDGNAEIVVPNDNTYTGLTVLGDADDEWVNARMLWNQHAYSVNNINDDLTIPSNPGNNWSDSNSFRQGLQGTMSPLDAPNLSVDAWGSCQSACGQDVDILAQVLNDGLVRVGAATTLVLYGEDASGARTELDRTTLGTTLGAGARSATSTFTLTAAEVLSYAALIVVADADGDTNECDEADNEMEVDVALVCN